MASKYKVQSSEIYIKGTDVPKNRLNIVDSIQIHELEKELLIEAYEIFYNGYKYIDYSTVTPKEYINAAIKCVQFAESDSMEKIILSGLKK